MLEIHQIDGNNCPVFVCDMCGDRLTDARKAAVVFSNFVPVSSNFAPPNTKIMALHVHKGSIDGKTCHQEADSMISASAGSPGWQEMESYLSDLNHNIGLPPF